MQSHPATASTSTDPTRIYPCVDAHCTTCAANASNCSACKLADGYLLDPYTAIPSCVLSAGIPAGYGANSSDNTRVYPCSEAYCIACSANASNCSACDSATNGYYLNPIRDCHQPVSSLQAFRIGSRSSTQPDSYASSTLAATPTARLAHANYSNCSACNTANGYLLHPFTDPPSCVTPATVPSKYGLNDTDSSRVYPCLETKCLACKANASNCSACDLAASVILNSFVAPPTCVPPSPAPPGYGVNSADLSRFYPCTDSNCISCAANISNCSACNLANGVLLNSYASVPACIAPGAVPSGYGLNSTDPTRIYPCVDAHCTTCAANASNCSACKLADGYLLDPYTAIPSCVLSAGIPAGYGANSSDNTRVYPCSEAYCICMQRQRLELFCLRLRSQWLPLGSLPSAA